MILRVPAEWFGGIVNLQCPMRSTLLASSLCRQYDIAFLINASCRQNIMR
jgi:hypothetical protein